MPTPKHTPGPCGSPLCYCEECHPRTLECYECGEECSDEHQSPTTGETVCEDCAADETEWRLAQ